MKTQDLMPIPSLEECLALMDTHGMLPHIREHSFQVSRVAVFLGEALARAGHSLNLPLVEMGALLHDLGKTPCLGTGHNHALWGAEILRDLGYPEVAQVVAEHVYLEPKNGAPGFFREAEIVNYADKRVLHTEVVTLSHRFLDLQERYGRTPEARARIAVNRANSQVLEGKIFASLDLTPDDLLKINHGREQ
jgi:putative nucleotidyltransferase with HDIG domain